MNSTIERLLSLRVCDIMQSDVVTIDEGSTMSEAAKIMGEHRVSGAPVVDSLGHCVGVLSVADFAERERQLGDTAESFDFGVEHVVRKDPGRPICIEPMRENRVGEHMSPAVQSIGLEATILDAARVMCAEHLHRLVVVDEQQHAIGVVSTLDLIAAMVAAVEE